MMPDMTSDGAMVLRAGPLEVLLSANAGGCISHFDWVGTGARTAILRRSEGLAAHALAAGSFPLVPYVNRIRAGRFSFRGRDLAITPNMAGDRSPLHGQGWLHPWTIDSVSATSAVLTFDHQEGEWPWSYAARQMFSLDEHGLDVSLTCRNSSDEPMPCGLGQHPYFACGPATRIDSLASHVWTIDEDALPVERIATTGRFDLADRPACGQDLDHGFGGWSGSATLTDPAWPFALILSSPDAHFLQIYSPPEGGICAVEPVTHANCALNAPEAEWAALGMRVLQPGALMELTMRIEVRMTEPGTVRA